MLRRLMFVLCIILLCASVQSQVVIGSGFSFNEEARDPSITMMYGTQTAIDEGRDMWLRIYFSKVNWGGNIDVLDNIGMMQITYWELPFWDNDGLPFKLGYHIKAGYQVDDGDMDGLVGFELYKQIFYKPMFLGAFVATDIVYYPDLDNTYFMLTGGVVFKFKQ